MPKNFDTDRVAVWQEKEAADRSFVLGEITFVHRSAVSPEAIVPYHSLTKETPEAEAIARIDETILNLLEPGQEENWRKVRDPNAKPPVTDDDLLAVIKFLLEALADRPTGLPSGSSTGPVAVVTGPASTVESGSPAAAAA